MHHRHSHRDDHHHRRGSTHGCNFLFKIIEMDKIVSAINQIGEHRVANDDDLVDRLSRCYTTFILVLFAALVSTKQYVGEPINCWVPARFTENHEDYTNKICWVSNTYYKPFNERFEDFEKPRQKIQYYQWIPLILIAQSILFFVPHISWRLLSMRSGNFLDQKSFEKSRLEYSLRKLIWFLVAFLKAPVPVSHIADRLS